MTATPTRYLASGHETEDHGGLPAALDGADRGQRPRLQGVPQQRLEEGETLGVYGVLVPLDETVTEPAPREWC